MAETVRPRIYRVAELNFYLREYLAEDTFLGNLAVGGEISGFRAHSSGHVYFTLKDGDCSMRVVMFRRYAETLAFLPADGDQVIVLGSVSLYERDGSCQLYAEAVLPDGQGGAAKELDLLKKRLEEEGLFAPGRKKPLPHYAFDVGVITSPQGAAWADIRRIAYGRDPAVKLRLYPAAVQGANAPAELAAALHAADGGGHDVLLIGRGGGADEDLAAFDTEAVVRAVAACVTPVISAVGHESDFSLCDLAADVRAATPTHGASLAVTAREDMLALLDELERGMKTAVTERLRQKRELLAGLSLDAAAERGLTAKKQQLALLGTRLRAFDPLAVLERGYALVLDEQGAAVKDAAAVRPGDRLTVFPAKGRITVVAESVGKEDING